MITDAEVKIAGFKALACALGDVDAERFFTLIMREPFDYTKWQKALWPDKTIEELSSAAMAHRRACKA